LEVRSEKQNKLVNYNCCETRAGNAIKGISRNCKALAAPIWGNFWPFEAGSTDYLRLFFLQRSFLLWGFVKCQMRKIEFLSKQPDAAEAITFDDEATIINGHRTCL
jgi:hypothetical protein